MSSQIIKSLVSNTKCASIFYYDYYCSLTILPSFVMRVTFPLLSPTMRVPPVLDTSKDVYHLFQFSVFKKTLS